MRLTKTFGLIAIAAVMTLVGAASASAAAEYLQGGSSLDHQVALTGKGGARVFETVGGTRIACTSSGSTGAFLNATEGRNEITFKECKGPLGASCTSSGQPTGVILTNKLTSELVNLVGGGVGVLFSPEGGELIAEYACLGVVVKVRGSVVGVATPVGVEQNTGTLTFTQTEGKQSPSQYELDGALKTSKLEISVGGGAFEEMGEEWMESLTFVEPIELSE